MTHVAVVDIGKTNAKLAIVDSVNAREIDVRTQPNQVVQSEPYPHFDITSLWSFLLYSLKEFSDLYSISSISITTHGACVALLDADGVLATPILDYEFDGPDSLHDGYRQIRPKFVNTGSPRLPVGLNVGAQLHWLFDQNPSLAGSVKTIMMYPQYWAYRFSGVTANEPTSLGCHTDLWSPATGGFSELVDALNVRELMAPVMPATTNLGLILPDIAEATGLSVSTQVYCGIHDSNASLYAHLNKLELPFSVVSSGTWVVCMSPGSEVTNLDESRDTLVNVSAQGKPVPSSRFMGGREYDYLITQYEATETSRLVLSVKEKNAFILPSVETGSGPFQNRAYKWTVDPAGLSPEERYIVISFYLALMTDVCLRLCHAAGPTVLEGPFTRNEIYCAMLSAATARDVVSTDGYSTGTSVGAALLTASSISTAANYKSLVKAKPDAWLTDYRDAWHDIVETNQQGFIDE